MLKKGVRGYHFVWNAPLLGYFPNFLCERLKWVIEVDGSSHVGREDWAHDRDLVMTQNGYVVHRFNANIPCGAIHQTIVERMDAANVATRDCRASKQQWRHEWQKELGRELLAAATKRNLGERLDICKLALRCP